MCSIVAFLNSVFNHQLCHIQIALCFISHSTLETKCKSGAKDTFIMMLRKFIKFLLIITTNMIYAQNQTVVVQGGIQDSFLKKGLFGCKVTLMRTDSTEVKAETKVYEIGNDSMHISTIYNIAAPNVAGTYYVRVQKEGYEDAWTHILISENNKTERIQVPILEMRKSMKTVNLDEVVVKATRVKMAMIGDTIVYDASAFNLPQGSMLSHLIEQLPGARMTAEGEIFINGRKIDELTLNSKSFFKKDKTVLLDNLPYYTVKKLKVFERPHLANVMVGTKDENPEYVMDVYLKDEYSNGAMLNADLAGGTHERYWARVFGMLLSKTTAAGAFVNANNVNDVTKLLRQGWSQNAGYSLGNQNKPSTRQSAGLNVSYNSENKNQFGYSNLIEECELVYEHYDDIDESNMYKEIFLPTGGTFSEERHNKRTGRHHAEWRNELTCIPWHIAVHTGIIYREDNENAYGDMQQWDSGNPTAFQNLGMRGKMKDYSGNIFLQYVLPWNINGDCNSYYNRIDRYVFNRQYSSYNSAMNENYRHEYNDSRASIYYFEPHFIFKHKLWKQMHLSLSERFLLKGINTDDKLYMLNNLDGWGLQDSVSIDLLPSNRELLSHVYDEYNSTLSRSQQIENEFTLSINWKKTKRFPIEVRIKIPLFFQRDRLNYQRGAIDTLAHHNILTVNPSIRLEHSRWSFGAGITTTTPGLMNMMPYRDERNPLSIMEGNPQLKNNRKVNANFTWNPKFKSTKVGVTSGRLNTSFNYHLSSVAQGFTYDEQSTAFTYRPENVNGNWVWNTSYNTTISFHENQMWWMDSETGVDVMHSVDYAAVVGMADVALNKVETVNSKERLKFSYKGKDTKISVLGDITWRRSWGHRPSQTSISAFDFSYGATAQHTIPTWNTTFNVDVCNYSRRGYSSSVMNRDECVVNASISKSILKGKMTFMLEGHDIFNQISNKTYEVNAQGRTEAWYRVTPSYIILHATYKIHIKPKI